ncbi:MAG: hypothetical protein B9S32_01970 [Verrucomicrobia bacterium Tous-C9LFEB]|nr:MAG: hypothetical protein B9S32_01970 [Verrucomicrobia bacterium Tous-C9LFEB]
MTHRHTTPTTLSVVHVVPFSHLDLFWAGTREECLSRGNYIISRALDLLEQYEDFTYLIETVNFLQHYVECYPHETARIKRLAASGRLELAPLWSAIYQNLPGGETLARNALYAKRYVRRHFDKDPQTAHFADLPGYTPQYPQIAQLAGIKRVVMSRGGPVETPLFIWQGLDGAKILSYYTPLGYAVMALEGNWHQDYAAMLAGGTEKALSQSFQTDSYPHLTHWGCDLHAPDENLILNVRQWNQDKEAKLLFSTPSHYFASVSGVEGLTVLKGEIPSAWPNIESSWPDLWPEDLPCESALQMAEFLSAFCLLKGWKDYPQRELEDAWKALLDGMDHNQNAQGGERADRDKLQLKRYSRYAAERIINRMAWRLAAQVPMPKPDQFPIVVFNSMSWRRAGIATGRAVVYGTPRSNDVEAFKSGMKLVNDLGETVPYVPLIRYEGVSIAMEIAFPVDEIPAAGYRTWYLMPGHNPIHEAQTCQIHIDGMIEKKSAGESIWLDPRRNIGQDTYENRFFRLSVDRVTGDVSVEDRRSGHLLLEKMRVMGVEERGGNYIANMTPSGREFPALIDSVETLDNNKIWCRLKLSGSICNMPLTQTITLYHDYPEIQLENEIDWQGPRWMRLQQLFPYVGQGETVRYGVPYGQVTYPGTIPVSQGKLEDEIPLAERDKLRLCRHWVDVGNESTGLTIACDHRMWELEGKLLRSYMIRGISHSFVVKRHEDDTLEAIARPPAGKYRFVYTIRPRNDSLAESASYRCGWELNRPLLVTAVGGTNNKGSLPARAGLFDLTESSLVSTAFKKAEEGESLVLRAFEAAGRKSQMPIPKIEGFTVSETDILEEARHQPNSCRPFEVKTLIFDSTQK